MGTLACFQHVSARVSVRGRLKGQDTAMWGVTPIRCGGQQLRSDGVMLVMGAIFHKALLALGAKGWGSELHWMCVTSPWRRPLLTGNGSSFSSLSGCLVHQSALSPVWLSPETMALAEREGARWRCGRTALQSRSSATIRNTSISLAQSNFELTDRHTHVSCHTDELRLIAARPTLSVLKGVFNRLMAQQRPGDCSSPLEPETLRPLGGTRTQNQ